MNLINGKFGESYMKCVTKEEIVVIQRNGTTNLKSDEFFAAFLCRNAS